MGMRLRAVRLPDSLVNELKQLSHVESLRRGNQDVTWSGLLREIAEKYVRQERQRGAELVAAGR